MDEFIYNNFTHVLCVLVLVSRLGDIISTRLVTPTLKLEANPLARKLRWPFIWSSTLLCLLPYLHTGAAIIVLVPSLLVSASNIGKFWFVKAMGESDYHQMLLTFARKVKLSHVIASFLASFFFLLLAGIVLLYLSYGPDNWGWWYAIGMITYAVACSLHALVYVVRMVKTARKLRMEQSQGNIIQPA